MTAAPGTLHRPAGSAVSGDDPVAVAPTDAGWSYAGLRVVALPPGGSRELSTGNQEMAVLPLSGSAAVTVDGTTFDLEGRKSVFARVSDWVYAPIEAELGITSPTGGEFALASALAEKRYEPAYRAASDVPVEVRGAGPATRQVNNFCAPSVFEGAHRLMCVELYTPDGNWSSYPPHRHDDSAECPVNNEEIYYFRIGDVGSVDYSDRGFGLHRTYTPDGVIDESVTVRDGDVFFIPRGYHGPCIAAPGYPMYYLNVLAGGDEERSMSFCDDPAHGWVRDTWSDQPLDERCPMVTPAGPRVGAGSDER